jgi:hypothetical protein
MTAQVVSYTYSDNRGAPGGKATLYVKWACTELGVVSQKITELISGRVVEIVTKPGTPAPTDNYDITLVSALSAIDLLGGRGADRDTTTTERAAVLAEQTIGSNVYAIHPVINEAGATFTIATAGDAKQGECWIHIE